jgi:hypothetical protein
MVGGETMPADTIIEQRLTALEAAVVELRNRLATRPPADNWVERFNGSFKDEPAFGEVVEYGRAIRSADRPREGNE